MGLRVHLHVQEKIDYQIGFYLRLKFQVSLLTGLCTAGFLLVFGVPLAILIGLLAFMLNFIPNVGSLVAMLLPIPLVATMDMNFMSSVAAIALPGISNLLIGNVCQSVPDGLCISHRR
jgi:AI-2 transport protein TqsA|eukprot:SAG25_NODE_393_length_8567_cov_15.363368_7_plen_118_part_00